MIGMEQGLTTYGIRSKKLMNVPKEIPMGWDYATPAPTPAAAILFRAVAMGRFIVRRLIGMVPFIFLVSITVFVLIKLPPGDFVSNYAASLAAAGETVDDAMLATMRTRFGLDQPWIVQYWHWIGGILHGDFGYSFKWQQPVSALIGERMGLTLVLSFATLLFTWAIALPIGVYSAVRRYSFGDYFFTLLGFIGLAVPEFPARARADVCRHHRVPPGHRRPVLAAISERAVVVGARRSISAAHLWIPMVILGTRRRGEPDPHHARQPDRPVASALRRHRAREGAVASSRCWCAIRSASRSTRSSARSAGCCRISCRARSSSRSCSTCRRRGRCCSQALLSQDQYLAGAFLLLLCSLTVVGTLISDILLALLDPRIRFQ